MRRIIVITACATLTACATSRGDDAPVQFGAGTGRYLLDGDDAVRPSAISDDGSRTYVTWPPGVALPAVYAVDDRQLELLVNGNIRGGAYVIDSVPGHLVFRLDKLRARADRIAAPAR